MPEKSLHSPNPKFKVLEGGNRSVYKLTLEEIYDLLEAMHGLKLVGVKVQDRCNEVWKKIAKDRGLDWESIMPVQDKDLEYFSAVKR